MVSGFGLWRLGNNPEGVKGFGGFGGFWLRWIWRRWNNPEGVKGWRWIWLGWLRWIWLTPKGLRASVDLASVDLANPEGVKGWRRWSLDLASVVSQRPFRVSVGLRWRLASVVSQRPFRVSVGLRWNLASVVFGGFPETL